MNLPFQMQQITDMEKYRAATWDTKEPETIEWIKSFGNGDVFYDIGANVGIYSLYCASLHPGISVVAFEPAFVNFIALLRNRNMNGYWNMTVLRLAVSDWDGSDFFDVPDGVAGIAAARMPGQTHREQVGVVSLDKFSGYPAPDHIKIDVDGGELPIILGASKTLNKAKSILVEVSRETKRYVVPLVKKYGFKTVNRFNTMSPHSRERRQREGIDAENIIFTRE